MNDKMELPQDLWEQMSTEEQEKFEELKEEYSNKRVVESKILKKVFVPKWLNDLELRFSEVPELLKDDLDASGDTDMKEEFILALYGVDSEQKSFGRYCKLFWNQRRYARLLNYEDRMTEKYLSDNNEHETSEEDIKDLKSNKGK